MQAFIMGSVGVAVVLRVSPQGNGDGGEDRGGGPSGMEDGEHGDPRGGGRGCTIASTGHPSRVARWRG